MNQSTYLSIQYRGQHIKGTENWQLKGPSDEIMTKYQQNIMQNEHVPTHSDISIPTETLPNCFTTSKTANSNTCQGQHAPNFHGPKFQEKRHSHKKL